MVALMVVPALLAVLGGDSDKEIVVIDQSGEVGSKLQDIGSISFFPSKQSYEQAVVADGNKGVFGFLVIGSDVVDNPSNVKLYTRESSTISLESDINRQLSSAIEQIRVERYDIPQLDSIMQSVKARASLTAFKIGESTDTATGSQPEEKASSSVASMAIAYIGGFMIYMFVFLYGAMVMQGVIEEKSSRIIEVIVSSVRPFQLMMGKIIGIALVALTQVLIWVVLVGAFFMIAQATFLSGVMQDPAMVEQMQVANPEASQIAQNIDPKTADMIRSVMNPSYIFSVLSGFVIFFIGGYLLYASMFAAIGSAVDNVADTQQLQLPVTVPLILALVMMMSVLNDPHSSMAMWLSLIPFTSPIIMMARIPYGVPAWELITSIVLLYGTFISMTWVAGKIYRTGIFMYGKKPSFKELIKWARYKN